MQNQQECNWISFVNSSNLKHDLISYLAALISTILKLGQIDISLDTDPSILEHWILSEEQWPENFPLQAINHFSSLHHDSRNDLIEYCKTRLNTLPDFFGELIISNGREEANKRRGAVFTPTWLANHLTRNAYQHWRRLHRRGNLPNLIGDLSCGAGVFLISARSVFGESPILKGQEVDERTTVFAKILTLAESTRAAIENIDTLLAAPPQLSLFTKSEEEPERYDLLIGNPPFVRSQLLDRNYAHTLRTSYPTVTDGNFDLVIPFIDHAFNLLAEGGIASYIVSNKFMHSKYGQLIRQKLASKARLLHIEDFGDLQLFRSKTTYTAILTFAKKEPAKRFSVTRYPDFDRDRINIDAKHSYTLSSEVLKEKQWNFATGTEREILSLILANENPGILEIFRNILQGFRTGANNVFILDDQEADKIESELLKPFVSGQEIRRLSVDVNKKKIIYPYSKNEMGLIHPISSTELIQNYPLAYQYFLKKKNILINRGKNVPLEWWSYIRTQNLDIPSMKKILVREMMPRSEFAADLDGNISFTSGYGLIPMNMPDSEISMWTAILNTKTMEYALRNVCTHLHSGWFRVLKHQLMNLKLPNLDKQSKSIALEISARLLKDPDSENIWERLDEIVSSKFQLTERHRKTIADALEENHSRSMSGSRNKNKLRESPNNYSKFNFTPVLLSKYNNLHIERFDLRHHVTFKKNKNEPIHNWYSMTQGFSAQLVEILLEELCVGKNQIVLDPFAGCGTTLLSCMQKGVKAIGIEISPFMAWITNTKTRSWNEEDLIKSIDTITKNKIEPTLPKSQIFYKYLMKAYPKDILAQLFGISSFIKRNIHSSDSQSFMFVGLIRILEKVSNIRKHGSHYRYINDSQNIGLQKLNIQLVPEDLQIVPLWINEMQKMIKSIPKSWGKNDIIIPTLARSSALQLPLQNNSIDAVITSPPYLNRNNYIAQQKAEMELLGLIESYDQYRRLVKSTMRSHVEAKFNRLPETKFEEVNKILRELELSDNNNPKIPHMIAGYFDDLDDVISELYRTLRPGSRCAFVVGNSRWGGVVVPVDHLLLHIAEINGFNPEKVLITRMKGNSPQQMRKYGKIPVRESIVIFNKQQ